MERTYSMKGWKDHIHFLELLARKGGRLLAGGEPDVDGVAKMVLTDFMRGKIPWFTPAPVVEGQEGKGIEGREGRLGEMPMKRKRDDAESVLDTTAGTSMGASSPRDEESEDDDDLDNENNDDDDDDEFEGFDSDSDSDDEAITKAKEAILAGTKTGDEEDMIPLDVSSDEEAEEDDD